MSGVIGIRFRPARGCAGHARGGPGRGAFTLFELLVAVVVMLLILGIMVQISSGTLMAAKGSIQQMQAGEEARSILDTLGSDFQNLIAAQGLTVFVKESSPNSILDLITQSRGPAPPNGGAPYRCLSIVYQLSSAGELARLSQPVAWSDTSLVTDAMATPSSTTSSVLAQGILRFEVVLVLSDGSMSPLTPASDATWNETIVNGQVLPNSFVGLNLDDATRTRVRQIIVGIVAVDSVDYQILQSSGKLASTQALFPSPSLNQTPMELWEPVLTNGSLNGLPKPVASALQVFQSTYPLN